MTATLLGITFDCSTSESYNQDKFRIDGEHTAIYKIQCSDITEREDVVITATGCPYIGMDSTIMPGAKCIERDINEVDPGVWEVEALFSQNYIKEPDEQDPWDADAVWSWGFETVEEPLLVDAIDGGPIKNSAGDAFPPVGRPIAVPVLTIDRYELTFDGQTILDYSNFVNSAAFWGADAGQVLCAGITAQQETVGESKCWKVSYVFKFKVDDYGWKLRLLDQGPVYWTGTEYTTDEERVPCADDSLNPMIGNLDGEGHWLRDKDAQPVFLDYNRYDEVDFNELSLGPWS